jgi:hypothetical protein
MKTPRSMKTPFEDNEDDTAPDESTVSDESFDEAEASVRWE